MKILRTLLERWEEELLSEEEFKLLIKHLDYAKEAASKELDGYEQDRQNKLYWEKFKKNQGL